MSTVLIIEDEKEYRDSLETKLLDEGFSVIKAENGKQGLEFVTNHPVDIILLDLIMPRTDGQTFMYFFQKLNKDIPIIILTNLTQTALPDMKYEYVVKSNTSLDEIVAKIREHITPLTSDTVTGKK